ncbi:hypothetical protein Tco_1184248 [Tanacetum coccineum]
MIADIKYLTSIGPSDAINNLPSLASQNPLKRFLFHFSMEITPFSNNFSLRVSLVIEKSDTQVITVKMEVLLEPTSNNLMVDSILQAGNHVKEILLKLNLPDHKSILMDSKVKMDNLNITIEEYIILQEEKDLSRGETFNWQTATYGKMEYCEDEDDCFTNFESEFSAIVLDDTSRETLSWEPTVSPLKDNEIDFRISFDESDDEDYTEQYGDLAETMIWYDTAALLVWNPAQYAVSTLLDTAYGNGYSQKDKNKAKTGQNRAREWKEREKTKSKAYSS